MSQWDKLLGKVCSLSKDLRFEELRRILESYGYEMRAPKGGSSHYTFRKPGCMPITIPKHEPIKKVYIQMVKEVVESEVINHEDDR
ncbi:type II toxin-antitoxin system HicA family toxin [Enterocloster lavalensis]|uniref:type II toxin-antitoxin system HicA family toxin n=1 Tax=Enterocloster lavalensis TaxID=460384 RepID=UPI001D1F4A2F|nr:type II toxin-antitoxin system HicA family toxin [Enterocloster lavalensis]MBS5604524.1 type II toxin-antitoxin system HicA family toxin [Enterocloster asparagiformis]